jgi:urease gamma subunit
MMIRRNFGDDEGVRSTRLLLLLLRMTIGVTRERRRRGERIGRDETVRMISSSLTTSARRSERRLTTMTISISMRMGMTWVVEKGGVHDNEIKGIGGTDGVRVRARVRGTMRASTCCDWRTKR